MLSFLGGDASTAVPSMLTEPAGLISARVEPQVHEGLEAAVESVARIQDELREISQRIG